MSTPSTTRPAAPAEARDGDADQSGFAPDDQGTLQRLVAQAQIDPRSDYDRLSKRLSPSRASDFVQCPTLFYYKSILRLPTPQSIPAARGTIAHAAFERIFDHPAGERTPELACTYIAPAWQEMTSEDLDVEQFPLDSPERDVALARVRSYRDIAPAGSDIERDLLAGAADVVHSWFTMERVNNFTPTGLVLPDGTEIDGREFHAAAEMFGMTLHGFIDRLDRWESPSGEIVWSVSDYKTGKVPLAGKKYAAHTMERIRYESFFQLRVYAVLCRDMLGIDIKYLRLVYVATGDRDNGIKTLTMTPQILDGTRAEVQTIWNRITRSARSGQWATKTGPLCNWCDFNEVCPALNPDLAGVPVTAD